MVAESAWIIVLAGLAMLGVTAKVAMDAARRRRQMAVLMARLEELESRLVEPGGGDQLTRLADSTGSAISDGYSADVLAGYTSHVARLISDATGPVDLADQAVVCIYRRIEEPIRPSDLADELCVSLRTLQRGLARSLNCSPNQLILSVKMREARRLLTSGRFRVNEVAHRLGFADAAHLSRRYRSFYRRAPSEHVAAATASAGRD